MHILWTHRSALSSSSLPSSKQISVFTQTPPNHILNNFSVHTAIPQPYTKTKRISYLPSHLRTTHSTKIVYLRYEGWDLRSGGGQPLGSSLSKRLSSEGGGWEEKGGGGGRRWGRRLEDAGGRATSQRCFGGGGGGRGGGGGVGGGGGRWCSGRGEV